MRKKKAHKEENQSLPFHMGFRIPLKVLEMGMSSGSLSLWFSIIRIRRPRRVKMHDLVPKHDWGGRQQSPLL